MLNGDFLRKQAKLIAVKKAIRITKFVATELPFKEHGQVVYDLAEC